jgi:hypothetical protein
METKTCTKCEEEKPLSEYYVRKGGKMQSQCKACHIAQVRARTAKNPEKNKEYMRWYNLRRTYGLDRETFEQMEKDQEGKCLICFRVPQEVGNSRGLVVDHNHDTGEVRGLLCNRCNNTMGLFHDDVEIFKRIVNYLS